MANYLTINSKFQPYSLQEMLVPYQMYAEQYAAQEQALGELGQKAGVFEMLNNPVDQETYGQYQNYMNDIKTQADDLATSGLSMNSRKNINNLRTRYFNEIVPIEQAYTRRRQLSDEQRKLEAEGYRLERDMNNTSLSNFINNLEYDYGRSYNIKDLQNKVSNEYKMLSNAARSNPEEFRSVLNGQYYQSIIETGYTPEEIRKGLLEDDSIIKNVLTNAIVSTGIQDWEGVYKDGERTEYGNRLYSNLESELSDLSWGALGKTTTKEIANRQWGLDAKAKAAGSTDNNTKTIPSAKIVLGARGGFDKDVRLQELTDRGNTKMISVSNKIQEIDSELMKIPLDKLEYFEKVYDERLKNQELFDKGLGSQLTIPQNNISDKDQNLYKKYSELRDKQHPLIDSYNEESKYIEDVYTNKYSHLGNDPIVAINRGEQLREIQSSRSVVQIPLTSETTSGYDNVSKPLIRIMSTLPSGSLEDKDSGVGIYEEVNGKIKNIKDSDREVIFDDKTKKQISVQYSGDSRTGVRISTSNGKVFNPKGIVPIDNFNTQLQALENAFTDYSLETITNTKAVNRIPEDLLIKIHREGIESLGELPLKADRIPNTNLYYSVLYDAETSNHIKIIYDNNKKVIDYNSLEDQISGGYKTDEILERYAQEGLKGLSTILTKSYGE